MGGVFGLLTVAFVVLKLTHVIDWSWWLVVSPAIVAVVLWLLSVAVLVATRRD